MTHMTPRTQSAGPAGGGEFATAGDGIAAERLAPGDTAATGRRRRLSTETKSAFKTTARPRRVCVL